MLRRMNATIDLAVGSILAVAAAAFGVVGLLSGLKNNSHSTQWFLGALIMGILAGAVLLDELRAGAKTAAGRYDAIAGVLLLLGALVVGTIGFIAGLANNSHAQTWLASGVVLAVLSLTAMADELRALQRGSARPDGLFALSIGFGVLAFGLGVVGFIAGLASKGHANTWLWAAVISSVVSFAWSFEAEHREAFQRDRLGESGGAHMERRGAVRP